MRLLKKLSSPVAGMLPHRNVPGVWIATGSPHHRNVIQKELEALKLLHSKLTESHDQLHQRLSALEAKKK